MEAQQQPQQSTEKYFFLPRWLVGMILVLKRVSEGMTAYSLGGQEWVNSLLFFTLRLSLSVIADYTAVRNPTVTTTLTTPPPADTAAQGSE